MIRRYDLARRQFDVLHPLQNQVLREAESDKPVFLVDEYAVSSDGSRLAVVNPEESKIHVIDIESGDTLHELPLPYQYDVVSVMDELFFSHDDTRLTIRRHDAEMHYVADVDGDGWDVIEADDFSLSPRRSTRISATRLPTVVFSNNSTAPEASRTNNTL